MSELAILGGPKTRIEAYPEWPIWLDEAIFCTGPIGVDDAVAAIKESQQNAKAWNEVADKLRKKYVR